MGNIQTKSIKCLVSTVTVLILGMKHQGSTGKHCIICGIDILIHGRRYVTLASTIKTTLSEIVDISHFNSLSKVCKSCSNEAESVVKYIKVKSEIVENFNNTCKKKLAAFTVKRMAKSQSPGRSPSSSSTFSSRKRLCLASKTNNSTPEHPKSRKIIILPQTPLEKEKRKFNPYQHNYGNFVCKLLKS